MCTHTHTHLFMYMYMQCMHGTSAKSSVIDTCTVCFNKNLENESTTVVNTNNTRRTIVHERQCYSYYYVRTTNVTSLACTVYRYCTHVLGTCSIGPFL